MTHGISSADFTDTQGMWNVRKRSNNYITHNSLTGGGAYAMEAVLRTDPNVSF